MPSEIPQLPGDDRPLADEEEQLQVLWQVAHSVGGEKRTADMVLAKRDSRFFAVERAAHRLKDIVCWPRRSETIRALS